MVTKRLQGYTYLNKPSAERLAKNVNLIAPIIRHGKVFRKGCKGIDELSKIFCHEQHLLVTALRGLQN